MPAVTEAAAFYVKRAREAQFSGENTHADQRRFIQQAELYLIKRQNAHFGRIEM